MCMGYLHIPTILTIPSAQLVNMERNFSSTLFLIILKRPHKCWNESNCRGLANQAFQIGTTNFKKNKIFEKLRSCEKIYLSCIFLLSREFHFAYTTYACLLSDNVLLHHKCLILQHIRKRQKVYLAFQLQQVIRKGKASLKQ